MTADSASKTQKQIQSEQTRRHILATAAELFAIKGFYGTSVADLAEAAGLTKGALYHHFKNKDALFFAVIESVRETWEKAVVPGVLAHQHALDRIGTLIDNHFRLISHNQTLCLVINTMMHEMADTDPSFFEALQDVYTDLNEFIEAIIIRGQTSGQLRDDLPARQITLNIVGMLRGNSCFPHPDWEALAHTLRHILIDGLRPR